MTKRFKVLAVNDERDFCECCGKAGLKKVVWIEDTLTGLVHHFGSVCALSPVKGFDSEREIRLAIDAWNDCVKSFSRLAGRLYRSKGGKYEGNINDGFQAVDMSLWNACFSEVRRAA